MLKNKKDLENENRLENIKELLNAMKEFDNLESFLDHVSLATSLDQNWENQKVNLMTIHASKGLEFDVVFLPGWEEGLFPHQKSIEEKGEKGLEEERRLAYVGITRAKNLSYISFAMNRFYQGDWIDSLASRFIDELPHENIKKNNYFEENEIISFHKSVNKQPMFNGFFALGKKYEGLNNVSEKQYKEINDETVKIESIEREIKERDDIDSTRDIAPLKKAKDAFAM